MRESYSDYLKRKKAQCGEQFDASELNQHFVRYFENGERIKVQIGSFTQVTGTVGVTTGWRPVFLLIRTSRSIGSCCVLDKNAKVIAVQRNGKYVNI